MAEPYAGGGDSDGADSTAAYSTLVVEDRTVDVTANGSSEAVTTAQFAVSVVQDSESVEAEEAMGRPGLRAAVTAKAEDEGYTKADDHSKDEDLAMLDNETADQTTEPGGAVETPNGIDDPEEDDLTPPPDSPFDEPDLTSRGSSVPANTLEDEIVVGTNANKHLSSKPSPLRPVSGHEDVDMDDVEDESVASQKRKRASTLIDMPEEEVYSPAPTDIPEGRPREGRASKVKAMTMIGYWRDSQAPDLQDKHAVCAFIDTRERLRTKAQPTTRDGRSIAHKYPLPPGPGGSWVTFQQVAFEPHLVYLNQHQIKEYVRIRAEMQSTNKEETPEQRREADAAAVKLAIDRLDKNPPPATATDPLVAYGTDIPEGAQPHNRPEPKKRKTNTAISLSTLAGGSVVPYQPLDKLDGTRPTHILVGYWKKSSELLDADKHAVFGVISLNDVFRVKLMRETRDGRPLKGNFPAGAGALWIPYEEVEFEPYLAPLSRQEVKEYCRVRQFQKDRGEPPEMRADNIAAAAAEAQHRAAVILAMGPVAKRDPAERTSAPAHIAPATKNNQRPFEHANNNNGMSSPATDHARFGGATTPESLDEGGGPRNPRHPLPHHAPHPPRGRLSDISSNRAPSALERTNSLARREIERMEAASHRAEARSLARDPYFQQPPPPQQHQMPLNNREVFDDNLSRLNRVWSQQEADRLKAGAEDAKIFMGVKYERKQNGPFEGKLVSQGTIISIDGEDFVEYRVLTKPTFF